MTWKGCGVVLGSVVIYIVIVDLSLIVLEFFSMLRVSALSIMYLF